MSIHEPRTHKTHDSETSVVDGTALRERVMSLRLPQHQPKAQADGGKAAWVLVVVMAAVIGVLVYFLVQKKAPAESPGSASAGAVAQAKTAADPPTASSGDIVLDSKGYIMPVQRILVSPQVSGRIVKLNILEGRHVAKDEVLAELEPDEYAHDLDHAKSALASAQQRLDEMKAMYPKELGQAEAELKRAEAERDQLQADYQREEVLYRQQKAISQLEFELAKSKYLSADQHVRSLDFALGLLKSSRGNRIAAAEADVEQAKADYRKAKLHLDWCTIKAPISGTILKKNAELGNLVNPIAMNGSFSLCDLADLSDIEVELTIQERDISKVYKDQKCKIRTEAYPERVYEGYVSRLMPIADRSKAAIPVRVKVTVPKAEEGVYLKPDMIAIVSFLKDSGK